jgi:hypothetical protein
VILVTIQSFRGKEFLMGFCKENTPHASSPSRKDGWAPELTPAFQADRNKKRYGGPLQPDEESSTDTIIGDAVDWLNK